MEKQKKPPPFTHTQLSLATSKGGIVGTEKGRNDEWRGTNDEGNVVKISSKGKLKQGKEGECSETGGVFALKNNSSVLFSEK